MIIEYFYSHKSSPLHLITRSATVAAMAESVSTWSMRTPKTDSVWRVDSTQTHEISWNNHEIAWINHDISWNNHEISWSFYFLSGPNVLLKMCEIITRSREIITRSREIITISRDCFIFCVALMCFRNIVCCATLSIDWVTAFFPASLYSISLVKLQLATCICTWAQICLVWYTSIWRWWWWWWCQQVSLIAFTRWKEICTCRI